ncbi:MAG: hypothetical protein ACO20Y_08190 [Poseidonia sp.]
MSDEQFAAFVVLLAVVTAVMTTAAVVTKTAAVTAVTVPSVLLLYGMAWDLRNYSRQKGQQ